MPYYNAGDYYGRGDYYQAGGLFSFLGGLAKGIVKGAATFFTKGPVAAIVGGAQSVAQAIHPTTGGPTLTPAQAAQAAATVPMIAPPAMPPHMALQAFGGQPLGLAGLHQRRQHPNKSTYVTRGGGTSRWPQELTVHPKGTELVTSRRMNVANPRALRRGLRRARGFVKLARRAGVALHSLRLKIDPDEYDADELGLDPEEEFDA